MQRPSALSAMGALACVIGWGYPQTASAQDYCSDPDAGAGCICTQQGTLYVNDCPLMGYSPAQVACCPVAPTTPDSPLECAYSNPAFLIELGDGRCCVQVDPYIPSEGYVLFDGTNRPCPLCGDQVIDAATQCCVGDNMVVPKNPIVNLAQCPNRVPDPAQIPGYNGCGPDFLTPVLFLIPQGYGSASFTDPCDDHDVCYSTCNSDKDVCDLIFGVGMTDSCTETYQPIISAEEDPVLQKQFNFQYGLCELAANRFYNAVHLLGQFAFDSAQEKACDCCP